MLTRSSLARFALSAIAAFAPTTALAGPLLLDQPAEAGEASAPLPKATTTAAPPVRTQAAPTAPPAAAAPMQAAPDGKGPSASAKPEALPGFMQPIPALRKQATDEFRALIEHLDKPVRDHIAGAYVAFDSTLSDLGAMAACDDDGDYVIALTDALLLVIQNVAVAQASDEGTAPRHLEAYAAFLAKAQRPFAKLPRTPASLFEGSDAEKHSELQATRLRDALSAVISHELAHIATGDIKCKHPTPGRESGDEVWTAAEQTRALEEGARAYTTQSVLRADSLATPMVLDAGRGVEGTTGVLTVFERIERHGRENYSPAYLRLHPGSAARMQWVEAASNHWRDLRAASR